MFEGIRSSIVALTACEVYRTGLSASMMNVPTERLREVGRTYGAKMPTGSRRPCADPCAQAWLLPTSRYRQAMIMKRDQEMKACGYSRTQALRDSRYSFIRSRVCCRFYRLRLGAASEMTGPDNAPPQPRESTRNNDQNVGRRTAPCGAVYNYMSTRYLSENTLQAEVDCSIV